MGRGDPVDVSKTNSADKPDREQLKFGDSSKKKSDEFGLGGGGNSSMGYGGGADAVDACLNRDIVPASQGRKPIDSKYGAWGAICKDRDTFNDLHFF